MLDEEILELRRKLDESIKNEKDYSFKRKGLTMGYNVDKERKQKTGDDNVTYRSGKRKAVVGPTDDRDDVGDEVERGNHIGKRSDKHGNRSPRNLLVIALNVIFQHGKHQHHLVLILGETLNMLEDLVYL